MHNRLIVLLLFPFFLSAASAQKDSARFRPGIEFSGVYSSQSDLGLLPSLTCSYGQHRIAFGPRVRIPHPHLKEAALIGKRQETVFFLSYRYYPFRNAERFRPFVQGQAEWGFYDATYAYSYDANGMYSYGPAFDHSFTGRKQYVRQDYAVCAGPGFDVSLWKGLYFTAAAGAGLGSFRGREEIVNDNGTEEYSETIDWQLVKLEWFASLGFGYRF